MARGSMSNHLPQRRILLVEDDVSVTEALSAYLRRDGFVVDVLHDGAEARDRVVAGPEAYDLFLIDLGLPGLSGERLCLIVSSLTKAPIIVISGRAGVDPAVSALELGADDYVMKPFSPREVVARARGRLRTEERLSRGDPVRRCGPLRIEPATRRVFVDGAEVAGLSRTEFEVLLALSAAPGETVPRERICRSLGIGRETLSRAATGLRAALGVSGCLRTVRGVGYRLEAEE